MKAGKLIILLIFGSALLWSGCKKKKAFKEESGQVTIDIRSAQGEADEVLKDVNTAIMEDYLLRGRGAVSATTSICGAQIDSVNAFKGSRTIRYLNQNCYGRTRSGEVRFSVEGYPLTKWKHKGAVLKIEFIGYKVVRSSDGKSIRLDGVQTVVNESGNTWFELWYNSEPALVYSVKGNDMRVTYDIGTATMSVDRRLTFTYLNGVTTCRVEGTGSFNGRDAVENWGQTTDNAYYSSQVNSSPVWNTSCGAMAPVDGEISVKVDGKEFDLVCFFGTDDDGNKISGGCPFGWRLEWSRKKRTNTRVFGYY